LGRQIQHSASRRTRGRLRMYLVTITTEMVYIKHIVKNLGLNEYLGVCALQQPSVIGPCPNLLVCWIEGRRLVPDGRRCGSGVVMRVRLAHQFLWFRGKESSFGHSIHREQVPHCGYQCYDPGRARLVRSACSSLSSVEYSISNLPQQKETLQHRVRRYLRNLRMTSTWKSWMRRNYN
jgi:hypothetical protein